MPPPKNELNVHPPAADPLTVDQALNPVNYPRGDRVEDHIEHEIPDQEVEPGPDIVESI